VKAPIFIDTGYILALTNTADQYHECARATSLVVSPPFLTTEAILVKIGNALSKASWRQLGIATLDDLRTDPDIRVVAVTTELFEQAVDLYSTRPEPEYPQAGMGSDRLHLFRGNAGLRADTRLDHRPGL